MLLNLCLLLCIVMGVPISVFCMEKDLPVAKIVPQLTTTEMWSRCKVLMDREVPHEQGGGQVKDLLHDLVRPNYSKQDCRDLVYNQTNHVRNSMMGAAELLAYIAGSKPLRRLAEGSLNEDMEKVIARHVLHNEIRFAQTGSHVYPNSQERNICITGSESGDVVLTCLTRPILDQPNEVDIYGLHDGKLQESKIMNLLDNECVKYGLNPCSGTQEQKKSILDEHAFTLKGQLPFGQIVFANSRTDKLIVVNQSPIFIASESTIGSPADPHIKQVFPSYKGDCLFQCGYDLRLYTKEGEHLFTEPFKERYWRVGPKDQYSTQALQLANGIIVAMRGFEPKIAGSTVLWDEFKAYNPYTAAVLWKKKVSEITDWKGQLFSAIHDMQLEAAGTDTAVLVHKNDVVLIDSLSGKVKIVDSDCLSNRGTTNFTVKNCGESFVLISNTDILLFGKNGICKQRISNFSHLETPCGCWDIETKSYIHEHGLAFFQRCADGSVNNPGRIHPAMLHMLKTYAPQALTIEEAVWLKNSASSDAYDLYDRLGKSKEPYCLAHESEKRLYAQLPKVLRTRLEQGKKNAQKFL
jgi:hypothetical protein